MLTTPIFGLQYAQGTDPAKQYPGAVDAPSKAKLETELLKGRPRVLAEHNTKCGFGLWTGTLVVDAGSYSQALNLADGGWFSGSIYWAGVVQSASTNGLQISVTSATVAAVKLLVRNHLGATLGNQSIPNVALAFIAPLA